MSFFAELFLAWRYFKPKRSAVSVITLISVIGVILGVAVLIVVLAVMTGFTDKTKEKMLETGSHAQIRKPTMHYSANPRGNAGVFFPEEAENVAELVKVHGGRALPVLLSPVLLQVDEAFNPKVLVAFEPEPAKELFGLVRDEEDGDEKEPIVKVGEYSLERGEIGVSQVIAKEFGLKVGSKVLLHSPTRLSRLIERNPATGKYQVAENSEYYLPGEFTVSFIFSFDKYDYDRDFMFLSLDDADQLFGLDYGCATHVYVWVDDPFHIDSFLNRIRGELMKSHPDVSVYSWKQLNSQLLGVLAVEKNMMFFLLVFIVLVAAFSIANTLITTVIQKTKEIGLLKSIGASSFSIMRIFIMQGLFVGLFGTVGGVGLGWLIVHFRMSILSAMRAITGQEIFPKELYMFNELPAHIVWSDVALISVISILLCTCGALVPAIRAAHLDPAKALRYE